ncbi:MAG: YraN family protein [Alphaproteobacteria bacterium]|nr:YraN family protein [Alphaproteobacteria bacterium]
MALTKRLGQKERTYDRGVAGEAQAVKYLQANGYEILSERYKTKYGEIDIIARQKNVIAFIEVKARVTVEQALQSITPKMKMRIANAALFFLSECEAANQCDLRFDVIAIQSPLSAGNTVTHIDNAWQIEP